MNRMPPETPPFGERIDFLWKRGRALRLKRGYCLRTSTPALLGWGPLSQSLDNQQTSALEANGSQHPTRKNVGFRDLRDEALMTAMAKKRTPPQLAF